jgi:hypothetical protein
MALKTILCTKKYLTSHSLKIPIHCKVQGWQKKQEILIFPRTAGNAGNYREILGNKIDS